VLPDGFGDMIAQDDLPPSPLTDGGSSDIPSGGGSPIYTPPFTGALTSPGGGQPGTGTTVPPVTPVTPDVPEPASFVLLLTGMAGAAGAFRHRFKA
jgi:PEP-CTERM motif